MRLYFLIISFFSTLAFAQILPNLGDRESSDVVPINKNETVLDSINKPPDSISTFIPKEVDYKFRTNSSDWEIIDLGLGIDDFYKQNAYQKDLFDFQAFPNIGQTLNPLTLQFNDRNQILPFGKSQLYKSSEQVKYYDVKTPVTEFVYEGGVKEGQFLSSVFTHNINSQWNYALNYQALKSRGNYERSLASYSNFNFSSIYYTKNKRYKIRANYINQKLGNEENAGLTKESLNAFIINDPKFSNRERMYVNLAKSQSVFEEIKYYLHQEFGLFQKEIKEDTIITDYQYPISLIHELKYKKQGYRYEEKAKEKYFSSPYTAAISYFPWKRYNLLQNDVFLSYNWSKKLRVNAGLRYENAKIFFDQSMKENNAEIPQITTDNKIGLLGSLWFDINNRVYLEAKANYTKGNTFGNELSADAKLNINFSKDLDLKTGIQIYSGKPAIHFLLNQSKYSDYNYNNLNFQNENLQKIYGELSYKPLMAKVSTEISNINNYVYLDETGQTKQLLSEMPFVSFGANKAFKWGVFNADLNVKYQQILQNEKYLPLPKIIAETGIYYQDYAFKKNANIQLGLNIKYFSKFHSRVFFPVLNEFRLPNSTEKSIGNYPQIDAFFNMRVRSMRIYFRGENLNSFFMKGNYFSDPNQPARDFKIQLGIHWYLFT